MGDGLRDCRLARERPGETDRLECRRCLVFLGRAPVLREAGDLDRCLLRVAGGDFCFDLCLCLPSSSRCVLGEGDCLLSASELGERFLLPLNF